MKQGLHYVSRCKKATGFDTHKTVHAATINDTLCGSPLDHMWYVHATEDTPGIQVTCRKCKAELSHWSAT